MSREVTIGARTVMTIAPAPEETRDHVVSRSSHSNPSHTYWKTEPALKELIFLKKTVAHQNKAVDSGLE